jgi:hypothetical protein
MYTPLTPQEIEEERYIEERRIAFLDRKIAMLSKRERRQGMERLRIISNRATLKVTKLINSGEILIVPDQYQLRFDLYVCTSPELRHTPTGRLISGIAKPEQNSIGVIDHMMLAPTEVVLALIVHECLHLIYPMTIFDSAKIFTIRQTVLHEHPEEIHAEEEWVRRMTESICGRDDLLEAWEIAVEVCGNDWKRHFNRAKQLVGSRRSSRDQTPTVA